MFLSVHYWNTYPLRYALEWFCSDFGPKSENPLPQRSEAHRRPCGPVAGFDGTGWFLGYPKISPVWRTRPKNRPWTAQNRIMNVSLSALKQLFPFHTLASNVCFRTWSRQLVRVDPETQVLDLQNGMSNWRKKGELCSLTVFQNFMPLMVFVCGLSDGCDFAKYIFLKVERWHSCFETGIAVIRSIHGRVNS